MNKSFKRRLKLLHKSGCIAIGIDHFLVVFPSILLVAKINTNLANDPIIDLSTILFTCGMGTIIFLIITKMEIPLFLGPSFTHISLTTYLIATNIETNQIDELRNIILWSYFLSGIFLLLISLLYKYELTKRIIRFLFPDVVMGPSISLIGLGLASLAVRDTGISTGNSKDIIIALITLVTIIIAALTKRKVLKNASVLIGVLIGCAVSVFIGVFDISSAVHTKDFIKFPDMNFVMSSVPDNITGLFLLAIPPSIVAFMENLGRITVLEGMFDRKPPKAGKDETMPFKALRGHAIAHVFSSAIGSVPNAIYAENLAKMNINSINRTSKRRIEQDRDKVVRHLYDIYSIYPYIVAALISIIISVIQPIKQFFYAMPHAIIGGMELFVFGLVAAPGIQVLVEKKINYYKVSNQIITASVLLAGISDISIQFFTIELKGMSLGLTIGVILNLVVKIISSCGLLNEQLDLSDVIDLCLLGFKDKIEVSWKSNGVYLQKEILCTSEEMKNAMHYKSIYSLLQNADEIEFKSIKNNQELIIKNVYDYIEVELEMDDENKIELCNDYNNIVIRDDKGKTQVVINSEVSHKLLKTIILKSRLCD